MAGPEKNKPEKKFRSGKITATIWAKKVDGKDGQQYDVKNTQIEKSYKDGEEWKTTNSYFESELADVETVARKAREYIKVKEE